MKILTKKEQDKLMFDLLDLYTLGSDALKAIGTGQADAMTAIQALRRQMRMTEAACSAAHIIKGFYGNLLLLKVEERKQEMDERHGFPLELKEQNPKEED